MGKIKSLAILGAGRLGKTLGRLFRQTGSFQITQVLNRSVDSAMAAVEFIGEGSVAATMDELQRADVYLIATADDAIVSCCAALCDRQILRAGDIVFHCSGLKSSADLMAARQKGAATASVHPIKSFADSAQSVETFAGTFCGVEGNEDAVTVLREAFERCGAKVFPISAQKKATYHAASVFSSNYLVALMHLAVRCYMEAGLEPALAMNVAESMMRGTIGSVTKLGTVRALTGPIARGDTGTVEAHLHALRHWSPEMEAAYVLLGRTTLELSAAQGSASEKNLAAIGLLLNEAISPTMEKKSWNEGV